MPLSGAGLCDADTITPKSASMSAIRNAAAGVGMTPGVEHVDAGAGEPGRDGGGDELARDARVAGDDRHRSLAGGTPRLRAAALRQDSSSCLSKAEREVGSEIYRSRVRGLRRFRKGVA